MEKVIALSGRLDTANATAIDAEIGKQLEGCEPTTEVVLDCSDLEYISSSGLRVVLKYKKLFPALRLTNVQPDVYSVFELTGFSRIMAVERALRRVDLTGCKLMGEGGNGAVYRISDDEIVKVSKHAGGDNDLQRENTIAKEAFILGLPTAINFDMVDCGDGRRGVVMEALDSHSLGQYLMQHPDEMDDMVEKYVELFRITNAIETESPLFRDIKAFLHHCLNLPTRFITDEQAALYGEMLDCIPDSNHMVHFDGHTGNVLLCGEESNRNLMLVDMGDLGLGHPVLEIAGWGFMMLEPDYADGITTMPKNTGMSRSMAREFMRRAVAARYHITDPVEQELALKQAALVGRVKSAVVAQRWHAMVPAPFAQFMERVNEETISLLPEIKRAIAYFVEKEK